jgi:DNA-binding MarR family transcriptional regulator
MTRPPLNEIFKYKDKALYKARLQCSYTLKDKAEYIGVHYSTVSRAIRKIERECER